MGSKLGELLKEVAPGITRVAVMFNPDTAPDRGSYFLRPVEAAAPSLHVEVIAAPEVDPRELLERCFGKAGIRRIAQGAAIQIEAHLALCEETTVCQDGIGAYEGHLEIGRQLSIRKRDYQRTRDIRSFQVV